MNYTGKELEIFQHATVWKNYYAKFLKPFLNGRILEVGAGIGSTTQSLCNGQQEKWLCLEPDPKLYIELKRKIDSEELPSCCQALNGTLKDISATEKFDAILYIDVLEHIENDVAEMQLAKEVLGKNGYLIVLVPAHQFLFNPFDKAIGHFRRYNKKQLCKTLPSDLRFISLKYLDSTGLFALLVNKVFLKQSYPSLKQVMLWDKFMIPFSKITDALTGYSIGKTLVGVWQKSL